MNLRRLTFIAIVLCAALGTLVGEQGKATFIRPAIAAAPVKEKTRGIEKEPTLEPPAAAAQVPDIPDPLPTGSGFNWSGLILTCAGVAAVHGLLSKYVVNPEIDKKHAALEKIIDKKLDGFMDHIDDTFMRAPKRDEDLPVTRRENDLLEERANREHQILTNAIDQIRAEVRQRHRRGTEE